MDRYFFGEEWDYINREAERAECEDARANLAAGSRTTGDEAWLIQQWAELDSIAAEKDADVYRTTCGHTELFNRGQAPSRPALCTRCVIAHGKAVSQ